MLDPINLNYPMAAVCIVNKPLICYQLEYLQRYGISSVIVTVEKKYAHKVEKYLKNHYKSEANKALNIELVVFYEDEEPMVVLKHLATRITTDFIVLEGNSLIDVPLDEVLDTHTLSGSAITTLAKEFDMSKLGKGPKLADVESSDIFGVSSWQDEQIRQKA
jgi:translation initiation factor eIF-2B subunit gamma